MSESKEKKESIGEIFRGFATAMVASGEKTDRAIEKLTDTVDEMTKAFISLSVDRKHEAIRFDRLEETQIEQGDKIQTLSDIVLIHDERSDNRKDSKQTNDKIKVGVITAVIAFLLLAVLKLVFA